ncbi:MAG: biotin--[acetyl-CoA-carboxylase] ligase [Candidatus Cryptobacteroides sp.]
MGKIIWLKSATSTNAIARQRLADTDNLSVFATFEQTAGRGQGSHTWYSTPGKNLTFSIVFKPEALEAKDALLLTQITTLSLVEYLAAENVEARIKWPNDIWVQDRKICGILIENVLDGAFVHDSIIGIGLNLNEENWPEELPNPVSLKELSSKSYDIVQELERFYKIFCRHAEMIESESGRRYLDKEFSARVFRLPEVL